MEDETAGKREDRRTGLSVDLYRLRYPLSCWLVRKEGRMEEEKTGRREKQWSVVSDLWPEKAKLGFAVLNPTYGLLLDLAIQQERFFRGWGRA